MASPVQLEFHHRPGDAPTRPVPLLDLAGLRAAVGALGERPALGRARREVHAPTRPGGSPASASTREPANTGTHIGSLWDSSGNLLGQVTFTNESAAGWQQANFSTPIAVNANTTYVASYFAPNGGYAIRSRHIYERGGRQRAAARAADGSRRRERRVPVRQLAAVPDQQLQREQLLGGRRVHDHRTSRP